MKKILMTVFLIWIFCQTAGSGWAFFSQNGEAVFDSQFFQQTTPIISSENVGDHNTLSDAQSTTGPLPPLGIEITGALFPSPKAMTLANVPPYLWKDGCGPTAVGMVMGYWDSHGYDWLILGSAATQTAQVNEAIASSLGVQNHYNDYALPIDNSPAPLSRDKSELPVGDEHVDNSIADFMRTSQSYYSNYYGWSWFSDVRRSFLGYFDLVNPPGYTALSTNLYYNSALWDAFRAEIDAGRPVVFLVDTNGDAATDHFITAIGYDMVGDVKTYAALNTWDRLVHWYNFSPLEAGKLWGIFGAITFRITANLDKAFYLPLLVR